jgi:hypothetical protein
LEKSANCTRCVREIILLPPDWLKVRDYIYCSAAIFSTIGN